MNEWIAAAIAAGAGLVLGAIAGRLTRRLLSRSRRSAIVELARPLGGLAFSVVVIIGLITALGIVNPDSLEQIPDDIVDYLPRVLAASIVLIGANLVANLGSTAVARALVGAGQAARSVPMILRFAVMALAVILAADQLGVDTTIVTLAAGAVLFGVAASLSLLAGLGGRDVASEIAAGRAWRTVLHPGDRITVGELSGTIVEMHPVAVEIRPDGVTGTVYVPNSRLLSEGVRTD